jgi:hypothetical protein
LRIDCALYLALPKLKRKHPDAVSQAKETVMTILEETAPDLSEKRARSKSTTQAARVEPIPLDRIKDDGGAQMRAEMRAETVDDYANDMLDGAVFPPVILFDDGTDLWLADGFHRVEANRKVEHTEIMAEIRAGTSRDAILHAIGSNAAHGLRRTQADKRRAVERLLKDPEWARWSDRKLAKAARVDHKTVAAVRRELTGEFPTPASTPKANGGEFPTGPSQAKPSDRASLIGDIVRTIPDHALIAECRRRGLAVEAADA